MKTEDILFEIKWNYKRFKDNIQKYIEGIKRWFAYFKPCMSIYDFDWSSIIEIERVQLTRVRNAICKYHSHMYWERDVERINLALKLLSIAMQEDTITEIMSGNCWTEGPDEHGFYEWISNTKYKINKYVNIRNAHRFSKMSIEHYTDSDIKELNLEYLRVEKAWYLYHKLRKYYLRTFWD